MGIIGYLLLASVAVIAVLVSAACYALRFDWKIRRAIALMETLPQPDEAAREALVGLLVELGDDHLPLSRNGHLRLKGR